MDPRASLAIVEDDEEIAALLGDFLRREGYDVAITEGSAALDARLGKEPPLDLIILDLMLPGEDGLSICRRVAAAGGPPVIILTAKGEDIDRVLGLEIGADDYVTKPFNPRELLARIRAVLRRTHATPEPVAASDCFRIADLTIDLGGRRVIVTAEDREIELTSAEFDLLQCFVTRPQRVLSRDQLLDWTRGREGDAFDRTIDVQLSRLRRRLAGSEVADRLKTVRNAGYILAAPVQPA